MLLLLIGCGQSYQDGLQALCDAPLAVRADGKSAKPLAEEIDRTVTNAKARALFENMSVHSTTDIVREEVDKAGITPCPLLDPVPAEPSGPIDLPPSK